MPEVQNTFTLARLSFAGPFGWFASSGVEALSQAGGGQSPGIYLWTSPTPRGEFVYYVGETGRAFARWMGEHLFEQLSGRYAIYEPEAFGLGRKQLLWRGMYGPGAESSVEGFVSQLPALAPVLMQFVQAMRFHVAPISTSDRLRRRIEAALAGHLSAQEAGRAHPRPNRDEDQERAHADG